MSDQPTIAPQDPTTAPAVDQAPAVADAGTPAPEQTAPAVDPLEARVAKLEQDAAAPVADDDTRDPKGVGSVVFLEVLDSYHDNGPQELTHAGLVVGAADGRVRVLDLGPITRTADLPADAVRVDA